MKKPKKGKISAAQKAHRDNARRARQSKPRRKRSKGDGYSRGWTL